MKYVSLLIIGTTMLLVLSFSVAALSIGEADPYSNVRIVESLMAKYRTTEIAQASPDQHIGPAVSSASSSEHAVPHPVQAKAVPSSVPAVITQTVRTTQPLRKAAPPPSVACSGQGQTAPAVPLNEYLRLKKIAADFPTRAFLAQNLNISDYRGTVAQNKLLVQRLWEQEHPADDCQRITEQKSDVDTHLSTSIPFPPFF